MTVVHVILPLPLDQAFSYRVPGELVGEVQAGSRVLVPFGRRRLTGVVVGPETEQAGADRALKDVLDVLDEEPALTDELLELTRWMAGYYVCSWGEAARAALPAGTDLERRLRVAWTGAPGLNGDERAHAVQQYLSAHPEARWSDVQQQVDGATQALRRRLERQGLLRVTTALSAPKARVKRARHLRLAPAFRQAGAIRDAKAQLRGTKQQAVLDAMWHFAREGEDEPGQQAVLARADAGAATVRSLTQKGLLEAFEKEVLRSPLGALDAAPSAPPPALHAAQEQALGCLTGAINKRTFEAFLLHGVTGSGKTEVYLAALERVRAQGRTGIVLVPEIALTPQTVQRFRGRFGDEVAVLHSRMSPGERYDAWRALRRGSFSVVVGPRSAVLAPLSDVGLLIVDEEHEPSYKQFDPAPRYHARDVAVIRAHRNGAVCILGSATPSLESYANARSGKYTLLEMPERVPVPGRRAAALPAVRVVDLTLERKKHRLDGALSETLCEAIGERLERGEQVILLQNRRGYAPVLECQACGWTPTCRDCSVTLTYHKARHHLRCHYCGLARRVPPRCPKCEAAAFKQLGVGTQRVEEELARRFPAARVLRMDLDTTARKNAHYELLERFRRGEADLLVGTQMVAKGLDFGRVTLVGVVSADTGLLLPDFRAEERTFQLLTQVAGRAGRAELPGEVVLQTRNPEHSVFQYALQHDYAGFAEHALPERRLFGYPPFGRVVGISFRGTKDARVKETAERWTARLRQAAETTGEGVQVLGPEAAFVGRVKRQYRYHTLIKAPRARSVQPLLRQTMEAFGPPHGCRLAIDVDAMELF